MNELKVTTLGIGHGDAILLQATFDKKLWTCLIDGGSSLSALESALDRHKVNNIDLLILSHLDTDHIGGLIGITQKRKIHQYWGPCLPAFERHLWLFGKRGQDAINRGLQLENELESQKVSILYPLEGYESEPANSPLHISVLSPPARLIRHILTSDDISSLSTSSTMPLGWLLEVETFPIEQSNELEILGSVLRGNVLSPTDLINFRHSSVTKNNNDIQKDWSSKNKLDPEFFGDSILNNTSIVVYIEYKGDSQNYRLLFPGDQENWTYLFARHPRGLLTDVVKASHHGGRVYVESKIAYDEFFSFTRPKVTLVSGNGQHKLPRHEMRESAVRWGSAVFCTSKRTVENVIGSSANSVSCHANNQCSKDTQDVTIMLNSQGIKGTPIACHSGFGTQVTPIIQIQQHIVNPSTVVNQLFENELRRHIEWIKKQLERIHKDRVTISRIQTNFEFKPIQQQHIAEIARQNNRSHIIPHLSHILKTGCARNKFWADKSNRYEDGNIWDLYALPTDKDIDVFIKELQKKHILIIQTGFGQISISNYDKDSFLNQLDKSKIANFAVQLLKIPREMFLLSVWHVVKNEIENNWCFLNCNDKFSILYFRNDNKEDVLKELFLIFKQYVSSFENYSFKHKNLEKVTDKYIIIDNDNYNLVEKVFNLRYDSFKGYFEPVWENKEDILS
jgi:beta-lactamase superfamily II metal-dependent hydrolase